MSSKAAIDTMMHETGRHRMAADVVHGIVEAIRAHAGDKFGWADVERISQTFVSGGFTRQALMAHAEIYAAYTGKKDELSGPWRPAPTVEQSLRAEIAGLRSALQKLRRQIVRYQIIAQMHGLDADALNQFQPTEDLLKAEREYLERKRQKRIDTQRKRMVARHHESGGNAEPG